MSNVEAESKKTNKRLKKGLNTGFPVICCPIKMCFLVFGGGDAGKS